MEKHINIPIFIPHEGCPNNCVFCNQRTITGQNGSADRDITAEIEEALATYTGKPQNAEIAFFGGSFTGIDKGLMIRLLESAYKYVKDGRVSAIRLSTRPDYISREILDILKTYGVTDIELGLQSMKNQVLTAAKRGHSAETAEQACRLIKEYGFNLVGQMMLGLPLSKAEDEIFTAKEFIRLGCDAVRIYPTVVFEDTELCEMAKKGIYSPVSVEEAVERGSEVYGLFADAEVTVLRIGLQATEALITGKGVYGGANHSALGELIIGEYYYKKMIKEVPELLKNTGGTKLTLYVKCAPGEQSKVSGQHKKNKTRLAQALDAFGIRLDNIRITADESVAVNKLEYSVKDGNKPCI